MMSFRFLTCAFIAVAVSSAPALACKGRQVLFEDKFQEEDAGWDIGESEGTVVTISGGRLEIKAKAGYGMAALYGGASFREADICVDVVMPPAKDGTGGGVLFWAQDYANWFSLRIDTEGYAAILRRSGQDYTFPVRWAVNPALKKGAGATNQLRIVLKGNTASTFINDRPFKNIKGIGTLGGQIGVYGSSEEAQVNPWQFTSVVITKP